MAFGVIADYCKADRRVIDIHPIRGILHHLINLIVVLHHESFIAQFFELVLHPLDDWILRGRQHHFAFSCVSGAVSE